MINLAELRFVGVFRVTEFFERKVFRRFDIRLVTTVNHAELFKVGENRQRRVARPAVTNRLKIIVGITQISARLFRFDVELHVAEIRRGEKCVIRLFQTIADGDAFFDFYFLMIRIFSRS